MEVLDAELDAAVPKRQGPWTTTWSLWFCTLWSTVLDLCEAGVQKHFEGIAARAVRSSVDTLVFGGGGYKGLAFIAALQALCCNDRKVWQRVYAKVHRCIGTSVGALTAACVASGTSPWVAKSQLVKVLLDPRFSFNLNRAHTLNSLEAVLRDKGVITGQALHQIVSKLVRTWFGSSNVRFQDVLAKHGKRLVIYATDLASHTRVTFSPELTPRAKLVRAICASCSVPLVFPYRRGPGGQVLLDGGLMNNYPGLDDWDVRPESTLFFFLENRYDQTPQEYLEKGYLPILQYVKEVLACLTEAQRDAMLRLRPEMRASIVPVHSSASMMDLLTGVEDSVQLEALIREGKHAMVQHLAPLVYLTRRYLAAHRSRSNNATPGANHAGRAAAATQTP